MHRTGVAFGLTAAAMLAFGVSAAFAAAAKPPKGDTIMWGDFKGGWAFAQKNNLPMMIHFTATWCGWCKKLEKEVYPTPEVIQLSQNFVCVKVDADKEKDLVTKYKVEGFPTILFLDGKGNEVLRIPGFMPAPGFIEKMKEAVEKSGVQNAPSGDKGGKKK